QYLHAQKASENVKPNIVLFIADDLATEDLGAYGNTEVRTPNIDRLAAESMQFTNAFASSPTCSPSRSSIFTGLMPFKNGAHGNHTGVKKETKSLVDYFEPLDYTVAIAGKYHVGPEENFAFERIMNSNVPEPGFEDKPGLHYDLNMGPVEQWLRVRKEKNPFMLVVADHSPHVVWPEKTAYSPEEVTMPSFHIDTEDTRHSRARYYEDITKMDANLGKLLAGLEKNGLDENTIVVFISDQGPQWAFGKWNLYDYGLSSPLLVRWKDHVKAGSSSDALVSLTDLLPTFSEMAGDKAPTGIDGKSFLQVLLGNTETHRDLVYASHTGDGTMNRSPMRMVRSSKYKYILNLAPEIRYNTHMNKAKDHDGGREYWDSWQEKSFRDVHAANVLYRYHNRPKEELYDLKNDPTEQINLAQLEPSQEILSKFRKQLANWRKEQGDFKTGPEELSVKHQKVVVPYTF
ncbi:hypothetical protein LCGC14_1311140, partial [marine sediment metagenome]